MIVRNLVSNALKFTPRGRVTVSCRATAGELRLTVQDTGVGIPTGDQAVIFELYQRGSSGEARKRKGTGVGLYIVRRYVEQLGGRIGVRSTEGVGSVFTVVLPSDRSATRVA